jgi:transcription initiation factor TFIIA large subunit
VTSTRESEVDRPKVDGLLRNQLEELVSDMDSGLFTSVSRAPKKSKVRRPSPKPSVIPQRDGAEENDDEDAINSDLDDTEDELDQEQVEEDGIMGEMILCTWDKVNRVKNKVFFPISSSVSARLLTISQWRCTLKDGILTTGGKE